MSNNEIIENEDQTVYSEQENNQAPSGLSLFADKIKNWLNRQNKMLVFGVGGVLLVTVGYFAYQFLYQMPREKEGLAAIYKTQELFDNDSFRIVSIEAPKLADKYSGTKAGELAEYMAGASFLNLGDFKKAIQFLEGVSFDDQIMKYQATGLLGDAHVENKNIEEGLKLYLKAAKGADNEVSVVWWSRKAARVYEKKNEWKKPSKFTKTSKKSTLKTSFLLKLTNISSGQKPKLDSFK